MSLPRDIIFKILQDLDPISYYNCISISKHFYIYSSDKAKKLYLKNRCIGSTIDNMIYNLDIEGIEYMVHKFHMNNTQIQLNITKINRDKIDKLLHILLNVNCDNNCKLQQKLQKKFVISVAENNSIVKIYKHVCFNNSFLLSRFQSEYPILYKIFNISKDNPLLKKGLFTSHIAHLSICKYIREYIYIYCTFISKNIFLIDDVLAKLLNKEVNTKMTHIMVNNYMYHILHTKKK